MNRTELTELIHNGENSGVEFKRDDIIPEKLAKEMAALLNLEGGYILLGVENDRTVSGLTRELEKAEEWVMEIARAHLRPAAIPYWETIEWSERKIVGIVSLPADAPDKPYKAKRGSAWVTQIRVGTTTRDATDEEEVRLYQQSGRLQYDRKPVPGSSFGDLDRRRLVNYFRDVRWQAYPDEADAEGWQRLLVNTELMAEDRSRPIPSAGGLLLFGARPNKYLPQSGITAVAYQGTAKDYEAKERVLLRGPAVSLFPAPGPDDGPPYPRAPRTFSEMGEAVEAGVIEQALDFVRRNTTLEAWIDDNGRRQERWDYPLEAVREAVVNAIAHRDYTITVTDIELSIYSDRLEVISPGRLPNTVTVEKMRAGYRASRNELIKEVLRDYRYIEATGLGVPRKIVAGMHAHNGTDPDLIESDDLFIVRLWKEPEHG
ncbi:MAG: putative DNA binding domain-containing protein [Chloroflexi bacterium]|nr:putative DNA binding domain-containing protein [Chloroflexota bacterium]